MFEVSLGSLGEEVVSIINLEEFFFISLGEALDDRGAVLHMCLHV